MSSKKVKPLQAVGTFTLGGATKLDFDRIEFHEPGGNQRFIIETKGNAIEITTHCGVLVIVPHVSNCITVQATKDGSL